MGDADVYMSTRKIRADFENLNEIAKSWQIQSNLVQASYKNLRKQMTVLQNGDWVGLSAQNFFEEMNTVIFPAFERLENAFLEARLTTLAISDTFQQAELDVAEIFKLNEGGSKGKGLSKSDNSSNHPWDADGFGWWAEAFSKQHNGRLPSEQDYAEFRLSWKFSAEGKIKWTDEDWKAFYEINSGTPSRLKKLEERGIKIGVGDGWTGVQLRDAVISLEKSPMPTEFIAYPPYGSGIPSTYTPVPIPTPTQTPTPAPEPTTRPVEDIPSWKEYQDKGVSAQQYLNIGKTLQGITDFNGKDFSEIGNHFNLCGPLMLTHILGKSPPEILAVMAKDKYLASVLRNPRSGTDWDDLTKIAEGFGWIGEKKKFDWPSHADLDKNKTPISLDTSVTLKLAKEIETTLIAGKKIASVNMLDVSSGRVSRDGKVSHWVEIVSINPDSQNPNQSKVTIYNPFQNRIEIYSLQEFSDSIDQDQKTSLILSPATH